MHGSRPVLLHMLLVSCNRKKLDLSNACSTLVAVTHAKPWQACCSSHTRAQAVDVVIELQLVHVLPLSHPRQFISFVDVLNAGGVFQSAGSQGTAGGAGTTPGMVGDSSVKGLTAARQQDSSQLSGSTAGPGKHATGDGSTSAGLGTGLVSKDTPKAVSGLYLPCATCTTPQRSFP